MVIEINKWKQEHNIPKPTRCWKSSSYRMFVAINAHIKRKGRPQRNSLTWYFKVLEKNKLSPKSEWGRKELRSKERNNETDQKNNKKDRLK